MPLDREKQKFVVVGVLGVAVLGIGAFQFLGGSGESEKKPQEKKQAAKPATDTDQLDPEREQLKKLLAVTQLQKRDPFMPGQLPPDPNSAQPTPSTNTSQSSTPPEAHSRPPGRRGGSGSGTIPPFDPGLPQPMQGEIPGQNNSGVQVQKGAPLHQSDEPAYTVTGVLVGQKPVAVFQDDSGKQFVVPVGGSVDSDTEVVSIERGKVTVRYRGKNKTLKMGGTPNEK